MKSCFLPESQNCGVEKFFWQRMNATSRQCQQACRLPQRQSGQCGVGNRKAACVSGSERVYASDIGAIEAWKVSLLELDRRIDRDSATDPLPSTEATNELEV